MKYYTHRSFKIVVSDGAHIDQLRWDYAFLDAKAFVAKYGTHDIEKLLAEAHDGRSNQ